MNKKEKTEKANFDYTNSHTLPNELDKHFDSIAKMDLDTIVKNEVVLYGKVENVYNASGFYFIIPLVGYENKELQYRIFADERRTEGDIMPKNGSMVSFKLTGSGRNINALNVSLVITEKDE